MYEYEVMNDDIKLCLGKQIKNVKVKDTSLYLQFTDDTVLRLYNHKVTPTQFNRMVLVDSLPQFIGKKLIEVYIRDYGIQVSESGGQYTTVAFMDVFTEEGSLTVQNSINRSSYEGNFVFDGELVDTFPT